MIDYICLAWARKHNQLKEYLAATPQSEYASYEGLLAAAIKFVVNPFLQDNYLEPFSTNIDVVDNGGYQGTLILLAHKDSYQPDAIEYILTYAWYGSCSGCDTIMHISHYDEGIPSESQVADYMTLALHLLQRAVEPFKELWDE
ncbi:MAG: hypothetical protein IKF39_01790 [Oscillospiraceae bacterium]|nr:hypothetical protein [Oscillospiraceae bacterium]